MSWEKSAQVWIVYKKLSMNVVGQGSKSIDCIRKNAHATELWGPYAKSVHSAILNIVFNCIQFLAGKTLYFYPSIACTKFRK